MTNLDERLAKAENEIKEVRRLMAEKKGKWKPEMKEEYWVVFSCGVVIGEEWAGSASDNYFLLTGNCFQTKEEAQHHLDRQIALGEVNQMIDDVNEGWEADWGDSDEKKYYIAYTRRYEKLYIDYWWQTQHPLELNYIKSREAAEQVKSQMTQQQIDLIFNLGAK